MGFFELGNKDDFIERQILRRPSENDFLSNISHLPNSFKAGQLAEIRSCTGLVDGFGLRFSSPLAVVLSCGWVNYLPKAGWRCEGLFQLSIKSKHAGSSPYQPNYSCFVSRFENSISDLCCGSRKCPAFTLRGGTIILARAAYSALRARATRKRQVRCGLEAAFRRTGTNGCCRTKTSGQNYAA